MISFLPLSHISTQLIDIYYMISVAGTTVFPNTNILNNRDDFFGALKEVTSWELSQSRDDQFPGATDSSLRSSCHI